MFLKVEIVQNIVTILFRYGDMIFSSKKIFGRVTVYKGTDLKNRSDNEFFEKCSDALSVLQEKDPRRYNLFVKYVGRVIGTSMYTHFCATPRSLMSNCSEVYNGDPVSLAGIFVSETVMARCQKYIKGSTGQVSRIRDICLRQEVDFLENCWGRDLSNLEIMKLKQGKCWGWEKQRDFLKAVRKVACEDIKENLKHK
jgi:hypothetical protein